jgi:hypothetical protein
MEAMDTADDDVVDPTQALVCWPRLYHALPEAKPSWTIRQPGKNSVQFRSWKDEAEMNSTYHIPARGLNEIQDIKIDDLRTARENVILAAHVMPMVVEQSPALAAATWSTPERSYLPRYSTTISMIIRLHQARLFLFGGYGQVLLERRDIESHKKLVDIQEQYYAAIQDWSECLEKSMHALRDAVPDMARRMPIFIYIMEGFTFHYFHINERCIMQMLWVASKREEPLRDEDLGRFLTRRKTFPQGIQLLQPQKNFRGEDEHALARADVAKFLHGKQALQLLVEGEKQHLYDYDPHAAVTASDYQQLVPNAVLVQYCNFMLYKTMK